MDGTALVYAGDQLSHAIAKTAHGLIRGTDRYQILGVLDKYSAGQDAGEVLDGKLRQIPIFKDLEDFLSHHPGGVDYLIIGVANPGGLIDPSWMPLLQQSIKAGISIVNGLHSFLSDMPDIRALADTYGVQLIDVRKPKPKAEQHFWSGSILDVSCPIIPVLGTDCAVGKRTTARMLTEILRKEGLKAEMIYTGQTGWMQGGRYGFIFDSTLNDFVSGELEHAIVSCFEAEKPDVILVEGQAALRNPSGPCGSEFLISGHATGVVLVHPPGRKFHKGWEHLGLKMPQLASEVALVKAFGVPVLGVALNTERISQDEARQFQKSYQAQLDLPVVLPLEDGVDLLAELIRELV